MINLMIFMSKHTATEEHGASNTSYIYVTSSCPAQSGHMYPGVANEFNMQAYKHDRCYNAGAYIKLDT